MNKHHGPADPAAAQTAQRRPKILVAAYACEPDAGSEPGVGWHMAQAISREHEVWVITRTNNRESIERHRAQHPNQYVHFVYADLPRWASFWKRGERGVHLYYYLWQFAAWRAARRVMQTVKFDLAHHVTFVSDYTFTFLGLLGIPFVWGPIGSNGKAQAWAQQAPYYVKALRRLTDPLVWLCAARAKLVIGNHAAVIARWPFALLAREKYLTHIAIGVEADLAAPAERIEHQGFNVLSVGGLIPIKAFDLGIAAFAKLARTHAAAQLTIVGAGPLREELEALVGALGVSERVRFTGKLPRDEALALMRAADAFLFPSAEVAGMVTLESMAHGVPVIGLRNAGVGAMAPPDCGFGVERGTDEETIAALCDCLKRLAESPELRARMGAMCRTVVAERYLWEQRHHAIRNWYRAALTEIKRERPAAVR